MEETREKGEGERWKDWSKDVTEWGEEGRERKKVIAPSVCPKKKKITTKKSFDCCCRSAGFPEFLSEVSPFFGEQMLFFVFFFIISFLQRGWMNTLLNVLLKERFFLHPSNLFQETSKKCDDDVSSSLFLAHEKRNADFTSSWLLRVKAKLKVK